MHILYIAIDHILSVTYDTRSGPTESRSTIADDDHDLQTSHIPELYTLVLALHNSAAQETLAQGRLHRIFSLEIWSNYASTPQTMVFRFTDLNDLLWFSEIFLGPYTSGPTQNPAMGG
jgi:hypothetical protein